MTDLTVLETNQLFPVRSVLIHGEAARAWERARARQEDEAISVHDAESIDKALGDPGNTQCCPLCNELFGTAAFVRHAESCIELRAPKWRRQRDRVPPFESSYQIGKRLMVAGHTLEGSP